MKPEDYKNQPITEQQIKMMKDSYPNMFQDNEDRLVPTLNQTITGESPS